MVAAAAASSFFSFLGFCLSFRPNDKLLSEKSLLTLSFFGFLPDGDSPPSVPVSDTLLSFRLSLAVLSEDSAAASSLAGSADVVASASGAFSAVVAAVVSFSVDLSFSFSAVDSADGLAAVSVAG